MPLFRFHRGGLQDSLETTVIVRNMQELRSVLKPAINAFFIQPTDEFIVNIAPYPEEGNNFDKRIGWYTQIVSLKMLAPHWNKVIKSIDCAPIGFLSEPLE